MRIIARMVPSDTVYLQLQLLRELRASEPLQVHQR